MLNITIIGHGAVGLSLGALFIESHEKLKLNFISKNRLDKIYDGFKVHHNNKITTIDNIFFDQEKIIAKTDILIVSMKAYNLNQLTATTFKSIPPDAVILIVSNGINNSQKVSKVTDLKIANALLYISCQKNKNVVFNYSDSPRIIVDQKYKINPKIKLFSKICRKSGINLSFVNNFQLESKKKLIITSTINGCCIFFDRPPKYIFRNKKMVSFLRALLEESCQIMLTDFKSFHKKDIEIMLEKILSFPDICLPSMYSDYINIRPIEFDFLNGVILKTALKKGIAAPINKQIHDKLF